MGIFHVHLHAHRGVPGFSGVDRQNILRLAPGFRGVSGKNAFGAIVLSETDAAALVWLPAEERPRPASCITVTGWPLRRSLERL
jgi:hypothetical protein